MFLYFSECYPGLALLHGGCVSRCPETFYVETRGESSLQPDTSLDSANTLHYECLPCHYSCQTCSGPSDDECVSCHQDAKLHRVTEESITDPRTVTDKAHCYPLILMDSLERSDLSHRILILVIVMSVALIIVMVSLLCCDCCRNQKGAKGRIIGQQPYKRLAPEEMDDYEEDEDTYHYYDQYASSSKGGGPGERGRRGRHANQTHLELISEDDEDEEDNEPSTSATLPEPHSFVRSSAVASNVIPPKVPLLLQSHSAGRKNSSGSSGGENLNDSSNLKSSQGPLV